MTAKSQKFQLLDSPEQMEPLLPGAHRVGPLLEQASDLIRAADQLAGMCQLGALAGLRTLLRSMNSYYSNKIEGQHTLPLEIEQALRNDYSTDDHKARRQRLAVAHMATELALESRWAVWGTADVWSPRMVCDIHQDLFARLPKGDRLLAGSSQPLQPGALRECGAGRRQPGGLSGTLGQLLQPGAAWRDVGPGHIGVTPSAGLDPPIFRWQWPGGAPAHPLAAGPPRVNQRLVVAAAGLCPHA